MEGALAELARSLAFHRRRPSLTAQPLEALVQPVSRRLFPLARAANLRFQFGERMFDRRSEPQMAPV